MTTSKVKAVGSAAEREVADMLGGIRVGQDGGPVDVKVGGYLALQVKKVSTQPSLVAIRGMLEAMPSWDMLHQRALLRGVVVIQRAGQGRRGSRTITFDLDDYAAWHGK